MEQMKAASNEVRHVCRKSAYEQKPSQAKWSDEVAEQTEVPKIDVKPKQ